MPGTPFLLRAMSEEGRAAAAPAVGGVGHAMAILAVGGWATRWQSSQSEAGRAVAIRAVAAGRAAAILAVKLERGGHPPRAAGEDLLPGACVLVVQEF